MRVNSSTVVSASLHSPLPRLSHLYIWPFLLVVYPTWIHLYFNHYEFFGSSEFSTITLILLVSLNALGWLICQWNINIKAWMTCSSEKDVTTAKLIKVIATPHTGQSELCKLVHDQYDGQHEICFYFQKQKFFYDFATHTFNPIQYLSDEKIKLKEFHSNQGLEGTNKIRHLQRMFELNKFDIPVPTFSELFREHAVAPFFVFQIFCVALWCLDEYWYYSLFTLVMLVVFESTVVFQRQKTMTEFRGLSLKPYPIYVFRNSTWGQIQSDQLLPGDLCSIVRSQEERDVPCDILILDGSCIVNEAMLSGESTPLLKDSILFLDPEQEFNSETNKNNILFGGTKILQVSPPSSTSSIYPPDGGCLGIVLRTGFGTTQGQLVRTMIYSTEKVSVNNIESLLFILFLLIFAIAASAYVWIESTKNEERKKSKILLDCILIITSVVPPELPMELSIAVNTSLTALAKLAIFCTEPFRIPLAGKVDICCFDKTGTLTGENLEVEGVACLINDSFHLLKSNNLPKETIQTIATAHALVKLDNQVIGDPMEKASLEYIDWQLNGHQVYSSTEKQKIHLVRRFQFTSALKRMSVVCHPSNERHCFVSVKGAPEVIKTMLKQVPSDYDSTFKSYSRSGCRVLALANKTISFKSEKQIFDMERQSVESELTFAGFLILRCPLKPDSKNAVAMLRKSSHRVIMITGDNPLTACHVAQELGITKPDVLILDPHPTFGFQWVSVDESKQFAFDPNTSFLPSSVLKHDLCLTGAALSKITNQNMLNALVSNVWIYARVSPSQKESVLTRMKQLGFTTLMCGDGTNDVGALKQAHIGVALLNGNPEDLEKINRKKRIDRLKQMFESQVKVAKKFNMKIPTTPPELIKHYGQRKMDEYKNQLISQATPTNERRRMDASQLSEMLLQEMDDEVPVLKLGDASVAAPFTSKLSSVNAICSIIRQGRCTLVATIQMYKILAINCLISAYSLSVLYLDGIKYGDFQVTILGVLLSVCFLCISRAQPRKELSPQRPQSNIFNFYIILSVMGQFIIHISSLIYVVGLSKVFEPPNDVDLDGEFKPSLLNTAVYLISLSMQVSTFVINYQGYPFRESLQENKILYRGLMGVGALAFLGATEFFDEVNASLQLVKMPFPFKTRLITAMTLDFGVSWLIEIICKQQFSNDRPKEIAFDRQ